MTLTSFTRPSDPDAFPTLQLFILAICRLAEPIALTSVLPYSFILARDFNVGNKDDASFYAGIFISAFALAEAISAVFWGTVSDRVGRKPVLLAGCLGTIASLLIVGFSSNFWVALLGRALGGFLNGNVGIIQTMVCEMTKKPEHEPRAYAVMPFVWSIGTIVGPAIGGTFARPALSFPNLFSSAGIFGKFPFLLPNLICASLLLLSTVTGFLLLVETHPDMQEGRQPKPNAATPFLATAGATADAGVDLRADTYGTFNTVEIEEEKQWTLNADGTSRPPSVTEQGSLGTAILTQKVLMPVAALGIFTCHSMCFDTLLPIFFQDERKPQNTSGIQIPGGLGLKTTAVGMILSVNGIIALFIQAIIFPVFASWLGIWRLFVLVTICHPIAYFIMPFLAIMPPQMLYPAIYAGLSVRNFFSILSYPLILVIIKEATPGSSVLGKVNGLAACAGSFARTLAPPLAGYLYGIGSRIQFTGLAWWCSGIIAIIGALQVFALQRTKNKTATIRPMASFIQPALHEGNQDEIVRIMVTDEEQEEV